MAETIKIGNNLVGSNVRLTATYTGSQDYVPRGRSNEPIEASVELKIKSPNIRVKDEKFLICNNEKFLNIGGEIIE